MRSKVQGAVSVEAGHCSIIYSIITGCEFTAKIASCRELGGELCPIDRTQLFTRNFVMLRAVCARGNGWFPFEHGHGL